MFIPHITCLVGNKILAILFSISDAITILEYGFIAAFFFYISTYGKKNGHWCWLFRSLAFVMIFCSVNYFMASVVIWHPYYYLQLAISWFQVLVSFFALYQIHKIGKTKLIHLLNAIKEVVTRIVL